MKPAILYSYRPAILLVGLSLGVLLLRTLSMQTENPSAPVVSAAPVSGHPRLWLTADDLPRLRVWAVSSNPLYQNGLAVLAANAKAEMDAGHVPNEDEGGTTWDQYPSEMYAELFAFMSLISPSQAERDDYAQRARTLLMHVMDIAAQGAAAGQPFRDPEFSTSDRSRWWGEGFALTVDWIYPYLSAQDKATIRQVFLRWAQENHNASTTDYNHPEPQDVVNDPALVSDPVRVRWSANNYYLAHMRNMGLMALALDPADDPGNQLRDYLGEATGAWLYVVDHLLRNDARGGFSPEGWEYGPEAFGFAAHFLLALHTAGRDDPTTWGSQVVWADNSFWRAMIPAFLHSLSPAPTTYPDFDWIGQVYQPAWYGDGQHYWAPDFIGVFGPMGLYARSTQDTATLDALRWIETYTPPGGGADFLERVSDAEVFRNAILYFMLFDPSAPPPSDPHAGLPLTYYAPGSGRILARSDWGPDAAFFSYMLGWITIDHQLGEGNQFEFYRNGEWLTKGRVGWDGTTEACTIGRSDYHNTLALENDLVTAPDYWLYLCQQNGSQWLRGASGDGHILAHSFGDGYVYAAGDATGLYNSDYQGATDIAHASRAVLWLQPDHIVVYDRAVSKTAGRFKRFWLSLPAPPAVTGQRATVTTAKGQHLFITTLLPTDAAISAEGVETDVGEAEAEPMGYRLLVEAPGGPQNVRFLHVLQGADAGSSADPAAVIDSSGGTAYTGIVVAQTAVLFPEDLSAAFAGLTYTVPNTVTRHLITGLTPGGTYSVVTQTVGSGVQVHVTAGTGASADEGGVLALGWSGATGERTLYLPIVDNGSQAAGTATPTATSSATLTPTPTVTATPTPTPTATVPSQPPPQLAGCDVFPADNVWNTPVDTLPLDSNSAAYISTIGAGVGMHPDFGSGTWDGGPIGIPYVDVPGNQPGVVVSFDYAGESDPGPYPIPTDAPIEGGPNSDGDRHVLVVERDNCVLYELYSAYPQNDGSWQAGSGAIFDLEANALRTDGWTSADAAGLPILSGLVRYEEVAAGQIRHALRFTAPQTRSDHIWPARHDASERTGTQYPPMGQRFRLRADFDVSTFSPPVQVILRALKQYGMFLADNGSAWYLSGVPDERWDNDVLHELGRVKGSDFEAVDESALMVDVDSGQVRMSP